MEDRQIVHMLRQRLEQAIDALAQKYGSRLQRTALNILEDPQDAEEAVNDTYLAVWNTVPPKSPDPLAGYVYKTGRNISMDKLKYNSAEKRDGRYDLSIDELAECIPSAALDEQVEARELGLAINRFLAALSADDRALFLRRYWFGDPVKEIAKDLGMRQNTATVRLNRLRIKLRNALLKEGYLDE